MKPSQRLASTFAAVLTLSSPALAGTATSNLNVSATVSANCTISTAAVAFGAYDPVSANAAAGLDGTGSVTVSCTSGSGAVITLGQGNNSDTGSTEMAPLRRMSDGAANFLAYALYQDAPRTTAWGNTAETGVPHLGTGTATSITIFGTIAAGQNVPAATYNDSVVATITF
ncbi:Csu type fimbrial protein [Myxococcus sp. Y35]|uniref:Csu type fimbrial protein n=1 Tax=Pseudomyxococcus flavus TaxID=3115648 RepID=UPI003CEC70B1